jgi:hypothetical protein
MSEPSLPEKVIAVHEALAAAKLAHAFGGALALAYYAVPRATDDIDINLFLSPSRFPLLAGTLTPLGLDDTRMDAARVGRDGQCRLYWGRTPLDLFFAYDEIHEEMRRETRLQPFADRRIPILGPEHLLVCKAVFDRPKDWIDIEQVLVCVEDLQVAEILAWLDRIVGAQDPRRERFHRIAQELLAED